MTDGAAPDTLAARYTLDDLNVFDIEERKRFLDDESTLAWELLYRKEPDLYERLIAGECIAGEVLEALPDARTVIEVGAGTGRLTSYLSSRYENVIAIEPAAPLRRRLEARALENVDVRPGFFDELGLPESSADLVVSCSAFTTESAHGGEAGLAEMERVASSMVALVWPSNVDWLRVRGYTYQRFDVVMEVDFGSLEEAVELARIFYPHAADEIARRGSAYVPYALLGMNPPNDWAWKAVA